MTRDGTFLIEDGQIAHHRVAAAVIRVTEWTGIDGRHIDRIDTGNDNETIAGIAGSATLMYYTTDEGREGKEAFLEKRKPSFPGR